MMQRASLVRGGVTLNPPLPGAHRPKFLVGRWLPFLAPSWQIQKGPRQPGQAGDLLMHEVSGPRGPHHQACQWASVFLQSLW